jgi:hypothetical protein
MSLLSRISAVCLALLLFGCAGQSARKEDAAMIDEAQGRIRAGDFEGAARVYQHLAQVSSAPDYYRLMAADAELRGGNGSAAEALLGQVRAEDLIEDEQYRYALLKSRLYLNQGRARDAMLLLDTLNPQQLDPGQRAHYHTLRASAYNQLGNMLESARERVFLGYLLKSPQAVEKNNQLIYDDLSRLPESALAGLRNGRRDTLAGWIELAFIMHGPEPERPQALAAWRGQFPQHPANGPFLNTLGADAEETVKITPLRTAEPSSEPAAEPAPVAAPGPVIGVLLPLSGPFAGAGQAIRGGMEAAYAADSNPGKLGLKFVDTAGGDVLALYDQLVKEGAQDVVGPLIKEDVARLAGGVELSVPVLALNQGSDAARDNLYQFGLTPEQEVEQSAGSAWFDGRQNALVLAPASAYGQRLISHFSRYWKSLGGKIVAIKTYKPGGEDFTSSVHDLLASSPGALAQENGAAAPPEAATGSADFVFMIADARDARLLRPQLEAQQAMPIPVYAMSQVFNGRPDAVDQDRDLNGVIFCDLPWMLNPNDSGPLSRTSLQALVERTPENYTRLIAMGIDAYNLVPQLPLLRSGAQSRFAGATGQLDVKAGNKIQRQLSCAQFESGVPQPRGIAPMLQPSAAGMQSTP